MPIKADTDPKAVKEAISLKCANCWGALQFANTLGGSSTPAWKLAHAYTLRELLNHAAEQKIGLEGLESAVDGAPVQQTLYFLRATGAMTEVEFQAAFRKWQNGE